MGKLTSNKLTDTSADISIGGRSSNHWICKKVKNRHGSYTGERPITNEEQNLYNILERWHLSNFEFGNWETQGERKDNVRAAVSAFKDLEKILGTTNIGFDKKISVAFGARGQGGGVAAHYEPVMNIVNITKPHIGCLAHELGHAFDYNFGSYIDINKREASLSGGHAVTIDEKNTGGELRYLMNKLLIFIRSTVKYNLYCVNRDYYSHATEIFARFFEQYIAYKLKMLKLQNDYLSNGYEKYLKNASLAKYYLNEDDFLKVVGLGDKIVKCFSDFLNNKRTSVGKFDFPKIKRVTAKDRKKIPICKFWELSNVAEFRTKDLKGDITKNYDYTITKHYFTEEELSKYQIPVKIRKRGWVWSVSLIPGGHWYASKEELRRIVINMPQKTFCMLHNNKKKDQTKKVKLQADKKAKAPEQKEVAARKRSRYRVS